MLDSLVPEGPRELYTFMESKNGGDNYIGHNRLVQERPQ